MKQTESTARQQLEVGCKTWGVIDKVRIGGVTVTDMAVERGGGDPLNVDLRKRFRLDFTVKHGDVGIARGEIYGGSGNELRAKFHKQMEQTWQPTALTPALRDSVEKACTEAYRRGEAAPPVVMTEAAKRGASTGQVGADAPNRGDHRHGGADLGI
ncbi:MAG: hypothetical protein M0Z85_12800 [Gammaproteobacteria bacterium]|nr:hypothetical protein [Gammaproteobacteria bacterium]